MYGNDGGAVEDAERTAFRRAEKKYKLYYDQNSKKKKQARAVDLSEVLDFRSILNSCDQTGENPPAGVYKFHRDGFDHPVFCLQNRPGFYFIPGALNVDEQSLWVRESLTNFPQPPNRTNHNPFYGPIDDLFSAANERKVLVEEEASTTESSDHQGVQSWKFYDAADVPAKKTCGKTVSATVLLRKLRWSTLGLQFDWSKRNYDVSLPHKKIPERLSRLAQSLAAAAMPAGEEFKPEAAIVNYFASGDTLGGHLDDMEADWSKPIVSLSLGCKAIFLLGGKSRDDEPIAMFLRSGDAVLMAGEARECFHGVPRIFSDGTHAEISPLETLYSAEEYKCFLEYIRTSRININIRQVY